MALKESSGFTPTQPTRACRGFGKKPQSASVPSNFFTVPTLRSTFGAILSMSDSSCSPRNANVRCWLSGRTHDAGGSFDFTFATRSLIGRSTASGKDIAMKRRMDVGS